MQRKEWDSGDLVAFLVEKGMTPQVASRRVSEVRRSNYADLADGFKSLADSGLYSDEERVFYTKVSKELNHLAHKD